MNELMKIFVPHFRFLCRFLIHLQKIIVFYENKFHLHGFLQKKRKKRLECPVDRFYIADNQGNFSRRNNHET